MKEINPAWNVWTHYAPEPALGREGDTILEFDGVQIAYLPASSSAQLSLWLIARHLDQWYSDIRREWYKGEHGHLLTLTSSLIRLLDERFIRGLSIEQDGRVGYNLAVPGPAQPVAATHPNYPE